MGPHDSARRVDAHTQRTIDARTQRIITAADAAASATSSAAADAAELSLGLGGPAFASAAAAAAGRLARHVAIIADQFAAIADTLRDANLHALRGRYDPLPGAYLRDVLGSAPVIATVEYGTLNATVDRDGVISAVLPGRQLYDDAPHDGDHDDRVPHDDAPHDADHAERAPDHAPRFTQCACGHPADSYWTHSPAGCVYTTPLPGDVA